MNFSDAAQLAAVGYLLASAIALAAIVLFYIASKKDNKNNNSK